MPFIEIGAGLIALALTAMAFTHLSVSEGAPSGAVKRQAAARARRLFVWAVTFWIITVVCAYLCTL